MKGKRADEHYNIAFSSGKPSKGAVVAAAKERKRKKVLEERIGKQPQPPEAFFCDQCKKFYFEIDMLTGVKRNGKCPEHGKLASKVREETPALARKAKREAVISKRGKKK